MLYKTRVLVLALQELQDRFPYGSPPASSLDDAIAFVPRLVLSA
jgi:hypothetical protein